MHHWWERKRVPLPWKTVWRFFNNLEVGLPGDLATPLLGKHPKELKAGSFKRYLYTIFIAASFMTAKRWEQPKYSLRVEWTNKM